MQYIVYRGLKVPA